MSKRGTMKSTTSRKSANLAMINSSRAPPRPTPSMVNYSDEDSGKGYDENPDDSDSLTEKPSEISSTDSQVGQRASINLGYSIKKSLKLGIVFTGNGERAG